MGESPPDPGDYSAGPWQRAGAVSEGGPAHPDETVSTSTEMEDWKSLVAGLL